MSNVAKLVDFLPAGCYLTFTVLVQVCTKGIEGVPSGCTSCTPHSGSPSMVYSETTPGWGQYTCTLTTQFREVTKERPAGTTSLDGNITMLNTTSSSVVSFKHYQMCGGRPQLICTIILVVVWSIACFVVALCDFLPKRAGGGNSPGRSYNHTSLANDVMVRGTGGQVAVYPNTSTPVSRSPSSMNGHEGSGAALAADITAAKGATVDDAPVGNSLAGPVGAAADTGGTAPSGAPKHSPHWADIAKLIASDIWGNTVTTADVFRALMSTAIFLTLAMLTPPVSTCFFPCMPALVTEFVPLLVSSALTLIVAALLPFEQRYHCRLCNRFGCERTVLGSRGQPCKAVTVGDVGDKLVV